MDDSKYEALIFKRDRYKVYLAGSVSYLQTVIDYPSSFANTLECINTYFKELLKIESELLEIDTA